MKFERSLEIGERGEVKVATDILEKKGFTIKEYNKNMDYDIMVEKNNKTYLIEVKTDQYEFYNDTTTNNMFFEIKCNGKASGLMGTKADYIFYYFPKHKLVYMIGVPELRLIIHTIGGINYGAGDGGRVVGYLLNRLDEDVMKHFKIYKMEKSDF